MVSEDAVASARHILDSEMVFRACLVSELMGAILFVFLVRTLYRLLRGVDSRCATLMVSLVLVSVPMTCLHVLNDLATLILLPGAKLLLVFDPIQRKASPCHLVWGR